MRKLWATSGLSTKQLERAQKPFWAGAIFYAYFVFPAVLIIYTHLWVNKNNMDYFAFSSFNRREKKTQKEGLC